MLIPLIMIVVGGAVLASSAAKAKAPDGKPPVAPKTEAEIRAEAEAKGRAAAAAEFESKAKESAKLRSQMRAEARRELFAFQAGARGKRADVDDDLDEGSN